MEILRVERRQTTCKAVGLPLSYIPRERKVVLRQSHHINCNMFLKMAKRHTSLVIKVPYKS